MPHKIFKMVPAPFGCAVLTLGQFTWNRFDERTTGLPSDCPLSAAIMGFAQVMGLALVKLRLDPQTALFVIVKIFFKCGQHSG